MNSDNKKKVLHLAPHVGAGVGTVVFNYMRNAKKSSKYVHDLYVLGYADDRALEAQKDIGFNLKEKMSSKHTELLHQIKKSDIILIHWWNHPLLSNFLIRNKIPPSRVIIWCHISGSLPPNNLTDKILKYPDIFVFTTPLSYKVQEVINIPENEKWRLRDIWSTGGVDHLKSIKLTKHKEFRVGYIGNVDYAKMHPDFIEMTSKIKIPDSKFIIVGGPNASLMASEVKNRNLEDKFQFTGFVPEKKKWSYLASFDVFGYPLAPHHYGSCDQVLQEAMAAGVVPVVLANPMESFIIEDGVTGIIAKNQQEYVAAIETLYKNTKLRKKLSENAKKKAFDRFSLKRMVKDWDKIFDEIIDIPKSAKSWISDKSTEHMDPSDIFIESLGNYGQPFETYKNSKNKKKIAEAIIYINNLAQQANWQSETKSTVHNFNNFLPGDKYLERWSKMMKKEKHK